jgi:hypothetical protein
MVTGQAKMALAAPHDHQPLNPSLLRGVNANANASNLSSQQHCPRVPWYHCASQTPDRATNEWDISAYFQYNMYCCTAL